MKFKDATRYEFRRFGEDFAVMRDRFAALGSGNKKPATRETYIVTRLNIEFERQDPRRPPAGEDSARPAADAR